WRPTTPTKLNRGTRPTNDRPTESAGVNEAKCVTVSGGVRIHTKRVRAQHCAKPASMNIFWVIQCH
ncbi:hypothetical protein RDWZM_005362, partial [Blomia tropicalis]